MGPADHEQARRQVVDQPDLLPLVHPRLQHVGRLVRGPAAGRWPGDRRPDATARPTTRDIADSRGIAQASGRRKSRSPLALLDQRGEQRQGVAAGAHLAVERAAGPPPRPVPGRVPAATRNAIDARQVVEPVACLDGRVRLATDRGRDHLVGGSTLRRPPSRLTMPSAIKRGQRRRTRARPARPARPRRPPAGSRRAAAPAGSGARPPRSPRARTAPSSSVSETSGSLVPAAAATPVDATGHEGHDGRLRAIGRHTSGVGPASRDEGAGRRGRRPFLRPGRRIRPAPVRACPRGSVAARQPPDPDHPGARRHVPSTQDPVDWVTRAADDAVRITRGPAPPGRSPAPRASPRRARCTSGTCGSS